VEPVETCDVAHTAKSFILSFAIQRVCPLARSEARDPSVHSSNSGQQREPPARRFDTPASSHLLLYSVSARVGVCAAGTAAAMPPLCDRAGPTLRRDRPALRD